MAVDKKTLLRDALKQVQAGKIVKAVETYKSIIKIDPRDASARNTLGDLLIKQGRKKEAIAEYLEVATLYENDGFGLRAIAICQKVINLDPGLIAVRIKLGDLYAKQKLSAEGRAQYMQVANFYDKKGDIANALEIFRKIANLEPDNLVVRVKLAGMFEKQKFPEKAAEEYVRAALGYADKKEMTTAVQLYVRAFKLSPANTEARWRLAVFYAQRQDWSVVVGLLETSVAKGSQDPDLLVLYAEALTRVNHPQDAVRVLEAAQEREPNLVSVNLGLGRAYFKAGEIAKGTAAINRAVSVHLAENRLEQAESLLREMAEAAPEDENIFQRILEVVQKRGEKGSISKAYLKLAEVYEKKNLVRNATGAIEKYLEINPGDPEATRHLEHLQAQTPAPKVETPPSPPVVAAPQMPALEKEDSVVEINLEEDETPTPEPTSVAEARAIIQQCAPVKASEFLEGHLGRNPGDVEAWEALVEARRQLGSSNEVRDGLLRLASLHRGEGRFEEARAAYKGALDADPRSAAAARGLADLLIEEEISIDLFDETDEETAIDEEPVLELEPEPESEFALEPVPEPEPAQGLAVGSSPVDGGEASLDAAVPEVQSISPPAPPVAAPALPIASTAPGETGAGMGELEEFLAEADFYFQQGLIEEAEFLYTKLLQLAPGHPVVTMQLRKIEEQRALSPVLPEPAAGVKPDEEPGTTSAPSGEEGLNEIFREFQRSVKEQLGDEDFETHYNLGIAYKEMGLMDEAVAEFTLAEKSPTRRLNAVSMIALCLREMGRFDEAALRLRTGISLAVEGSEDQKGFLYDLATLHEQAGRAADAQDALRRLQDIDPDYRDVAARVGAAPPPASTPPPKKSKVSYL